jgi:branched-chain amino acid transport system ATP-binding protein
MSDAILQALAKTIRQIRERGLTIVLVEQNFHFAAPLADRHYIIEHGAVAEVLKAAEAESKKDRINQYLSV